MCSLTVLHMHTVTMPYMYTLTLPVALPHIYTLTVLDMHIVTMRYMYTLNLLHMYIMYHMFSTCTSWPLRLHP